MNAKVTEDMSMEEMLAEVNKQIAANSIDFNRRNGRPDDAPVDPADAAACEGCQ